MACPAAPRLLLAVTLSLLGSPVAPASQPEQGQAGGQSGQPLDPESAARESVLLSVYVRLEFSDTTWPPALSRALTLPPASAASSPRTLTGLGLTTECVYGQQASRCSCLPGFGWNASVCARHGLFHSPDGSHQQCGCLVFSHPVPGYCQLLPPVPGNLSLDSQLQKPGNTLTLTLNLNQEATKVRWFLRRPGNPRPILLQAGTQVSFTYSQGQPALSISQMSQYWAGEYITYFEAQGFRWKLQQTVRVPLQEREVTRFPEELSVSCTTSPGFQLSCCIPSTDLAYTAAWSPGNGSQASLLNAPGSQCLVLAVQHCPKSDTTYTCVLQSPGLDPLRAPVSITIIRDGDKTCPEDFSTVAWGTTKVGSMAQARCPMNRSGVMKRRCRDDGVWDPIQNNCIDSEILALNIKAKLLQAGQGEPAEEVPRILAWLPRQVEVVSSPSDLAATLSTVSLLAEVVAKGRRQLQRGALEDLLTTTNKVLDKNANSLWIQAQAQNPKMGSDFLQAVETLVRSLCPEDHPLSFNSSNVLLQSQLLGPMIPDDYRVSFSTRPPLQAQIPRHSLAPLVQNGTNISITSLVLQKLDELLPSNYGQGLGGSLYVTPGLVLVISIMADGQAFTQPEVIMDFGDTDKTMHCVFWNHSLFQGEGGWSDKGCQAQADSAGSATRCVCQHLTAFSMLMSRHAVPRDPVLYLLSQVGLGTSILALLVCLGVYRVVWRVVVRNKVAFFRHAALFNMVICLLAADTCFLGAPFLPQGPHSPLCLAAAFLCHFFYLATFFWMLGQALVLAHQLIFVFHQLSKHLVLPLMMILGYLCPLGFAGVTLGLYLPQGQYLRQGKCWLDGEGGAMYIFAGPVLAIVAVNGLVLAMAVLKLLRPSLSEGPPVEKRKALLGVIKALLILTPVFGLTWGLGVAILVEEGSIVSHYVFTVLNTFQGVFILFFGCLTDRKVQEALRKRFCRTQAPNSAISLVTNDSCISEQNKGGSENASYEG